MNLYFLVEGDQTEMQLYPAWLKILLPELTQIHDYRTAKKNNYLMFSGGGIPSIYKHTVDAIKDINAQGNYDYLFVCLDSDEVKVERRKEKLLEHLQKENIQLEKPCELKIIVHHRCVETWFLGNRKVYKRNPEGENFRKYAQFYNVEKDDPELMPKLEGFVNTSRFHYAYLREMLKEYNINYRKSRPREVLEASYLDELCARTEDCPDHLKSFAFFLESINEIKQKIS